MDTSADEDTRRFSHSTGAAGGGVGRGFWEGLGREEFLLVGEEEAGPVREGLKCLCGCDGNGWWFLGVRERWENGRGVGEREGNQEEVCGKC